MFGPGNWLKSLKKQTNMQLIDLLSMPYFGTGNSFSHTVHVYNTMFC